MSDCIFEIHQLWQSGFSRVYSYYCCSCSFNPEIIKLVSHLIRYIAIAYWIFKCLQQFQMSIRKMSGSLLYEPRTSADKSCMLLNVSILSLKFRISKKNNLIWRRRRWPNIFFQKHYEEQWVQQKIFRNHSEIPNNKIIKLLIKLIVFYGILLDIFL